MTQTNRTSDGLGAVFTRPWAVRLVLDMAGYTSDHDLGAGRAIEPSCGGGAFISAMIDRLAESCRRHERRLGDSFNAIWARDLDPSAVAASQAAAQQRLRFHGVAPARAEELARTWIQQGDFLLDECPPADWVVGNPPYVRLEDVSSLRSSKYRERWSTMSGRADVYVGFIQAGLTALRPGGVLAYICADRWMRNQYGGRLRRMIEDSFAVDGVITLHDSDPFEKRVAAYPAAFALRNGPHRTAFVADADRSFGETGAQHFAHRYAQRTRLGTLTTGPGYSATRLASWFENMPSWPAGAPDQIATVTEIEKRHPRLEDAANGIRLGIGLTTGADAAYLTTSETAVEEDQLLPMVMAGDIRTGAVQWSGTHLINPWKGSTLVDLNTHPKASAHLTAHQDRLKARPIARRQPHQWYRTIDKPIDGLCLAPKLLVADLRPRVTPVLEPGGLYPHHNLFWITSTTWDLRVLGGLLLSDYATLFVETYSPRMSGGALRVTAQYLRRICIPELHSIPRQARAALATAFDRRDVRAATRIAEAAYHR